MSGSYLTHLTLVCPNCSTVNHLTADALPDSHGVSYSRCETPLDRRGVLKGGAACRDTADL